MPVVAVTVAGRTAPLSARRVVAAVSLVLRRERKRARINVTVIGAVRMRRLNAEWMGHDWPTDVLSFALPDAGGELFGDVYVCRPVAVREARRRRIALSQELLRLVIHGTLHVIGYDHPEDESRTASPMWRRQERYLACLN